MKFETILKHLLGIFLILMGANKFLGFMPPMRLSTEATAFMQSLFETGYIMAIVGGMEILCGFMLLRQNTTPVGLILLAPISFNIIMFHLFLDPTTIWMALFVSVANLYLLYKNRDFYSPMFFSIINGKNITKQRLKEYNLSYNLR